MKQAFFLCKMLWELDMINRIATLLLLF
ncbi:uncharacterized protein METZ01_LOCUS314463 [marine metagenome]|uniref:Uncharacterized protein n=1 Tax=marine metagenome TaxID=408172 RepID=A0A382NK82_9ZZZZ